LSKRRSGINNLCLLGHLQAKQTTAGICVCVTTAVFRSAAMSRSLSDICTQYIVPAFCHITFPLCVVDGGVVGDVRRQLQVRRLCREDCLMLETKYCETEYSAVRRRDNPGLYFTADTSKMTLPLRAAYLHVSV